ncbi:MAG: retropepsin-like aspartic protease family protein [Hyphomicrobium sp.]
MMAWLLLAFLVIAGVLFLLRGDVQVLSTMDNTEIAILAAGVLLIAVYLLLILADERSRPLRAIRYLMTWAAFGLFLVTSYTYRQELSAVAYRVAGELLPAGQTMVVETEDKSERAVRVRKRFDGHFSVRASINGQAMLLLVDTGASTVVLKPADAASAGVDTRDLSYTVPVQTANGLTYAAPVRLRSIAIGPLVIHNVDALVARPGSVNENLLGMSFLTRLRSYEFSKDFLTLRG